MPSLLSLPLIPALCSLVAGVPRMSTLPTPYFYLLSGLGVAHPSLSRLPCVRSAFCCSGGAPSLPLLFEGCPTLPLPIPQVVREERVFLLGGCPPLLRSLAAHVGILLTGWGVLLHPLSAYRKRALLGCPHPPPPLVSACVKRALLFGGSLLLLLFLWLAVYEGLLPPCAVVLVSAQRVLSSPHPPALCCCRQLCCLHCPPRLPHFSSILPPSVPVSPPCSPTPTSTVPRALASSCAAPRASSPGPGRQYWL